MDNYISYDLYGGFGFRVIYEPSPLFIFFANNSMQSMESNVDTKEVIKVFNILKGRGVFKKGNYKDLGGIIFLFGSLYFSVMGMINLRSSMFIKYMGSIIKAVKSIFFRLIFLILIFVFIYSINYYCAKLNGISFTHTETTTYISYCSFSTLYLSFFYVIGLIIFLIFKSRKKIILFAILFIFLFGVPEISKLYLFSNSKKIPSNESLDKSKLEVLMNSDKETRRKVLKLVKEKKDFNTIKQAMKKGMAEYLEDGYIKNKEREKEFAEIVSSVIDSNENSSVIFPTNYYVFLTKELSTMGYYGYRDFVNYLVKIRDEFMKYYYHKRYDSDDEKIEPFVKKDENIFKASVQLPESFLKGAVITAIITFLLFLASFIILYLRSKKIPAVDKSGIQTKKGRTTFVLRKKIEERNKLFLSYQSQKNTVCIDQVTLGDIDVGIKPADMLTHYSKISGNDPKFASGTLKVLGIENIKNIKRKNLSDEIMKKIYAAAIMVDEAEIIVVNDFLKGESKAFEQQFLTLLQLMEAKEKIIIYLSSEPYETALRQTYLSDEVKDTDRIIDLTEVSLR